MPALELVPALVAALVQGPLAALHTTTLAATSLAATAVASTAAPVYGGASPSPMALAVRDACVCGHMW